MEIIVSAEKIHIYRISDNVLKLLRNNDILLYI